MPALEAATRNASTASPRRGPEGAMDLATSPHAQGARALDVALSAAALALLAPVLALAALAVRIDSPGPIFSRRRRVGRSGRVVEVLEFRCVDAAGPTPVGRFLRRTSLDLLPRLWNVLCGDLWITDAGAPARDAVAAGPARPR